MEAGSIFPELGHEQQWPNKNRARLTESDGGRVMLNESMRTVLVALGSGLGVALAKVAVAVFTGSSAMAAEASHSLADTANDFFLFIAQRRSTRRPDDRHPLVWAGSLLLGADRGPRRVRRRCGVRL
jgi:Co/Zn/Cd efflux system component